MHDQFYNSITLKYALVPLILAVASSFSIYKSDPQLQARAVKSNNPASESIYQLLDLPVEKMKNTTGVFTIESGGNSLITRLWLFEHAQKSIDIQYYSFGRDVTGIIACEYVVRAANRGVKVRLLVDEAAGKMNPHAVQVLDAHENIEVRVYNAGLRLGLPLRRLKKLAENHHRILRRMHNKTLNIDECVAITGGRNISAEYFDFDKRYNFRDRDVVLMGKTAGDVKNSFDQFWNDELTVKYSDLSGREKPFTEQSLFEDLRGEAKDTSIYLPKIRERVRAFPDHFTALKSNGQFSMVNHVSFVSDKPGKNEDRKHWKGGICNDSIISLITQSKHTLDIQSPYFITTDSGKKMLRDAVLRGVKVRILTNSLASTDNHEAFSGYQRERKKNLATGVEIYEFKPDAAVRYKLMIPDVQAPLNYKPVYGLHSKTMIIDGKIAVIGSYNLDPRSANLNTECVAVIRSEEVVHELAKYIEEEFQSQNAWRTTRECNPDQKASLKKRIKVFSRRVIPKRLL